MGKNIPRGLSWGFVSGLIAAAGNIFFYLALAAGADTSIAIPLAYYLDAQATEAFLPSARQRQNVINLCKLIGYSRRGFPGSPGPSRW